jgi:hypothetical protein
MLSAAAVAPFDPEAAGNAVTASHMHARLLSRAAAITQRRNDFLQFVLHNTLFPMRIWWLRSLCTKFWQSGFSQLRGITRPFSEL